MSLDTIRLSQGGRDQLIQLKRRTGIEHWNTLSRWGLCMSLAETSAPRAQPIPSDSSIEMAWRTFSGVHDEVYRGLLGYRFAQEVSDETTSLEHMRRHLHRGIGYLAGDPRRMSIAGLLSIAVDAWEAAESDA